MTTNRLGDAPEAAALDPEIARIVEAMGEAPNLDLDALPLDEALRMVRQWPEVPPPPNSEDRQVDVGSGRQVRVRLYFPEPGRRGLPVLMHLHGGGFVSGFIEMDDARCGKLAHDACCIVASVEYPLAPEHPFPEPIEDSFAVWRWITTSAAEFGGDPSRVAISGSSAGGHLAVGVTLLTRERDAQAPLLPLLTYPVVGPGLATASYAAFARGRFLTRARMAWFWKQYTGAGRPEGPLWSPLTTDLRGLPPAHVITAEYDVLRDEGEAYAARLRDAGVSATLTRYEGMIHGFLTVAAGHRVSGAALDESARRLRAAFETKSR